MSLYRATSPQIAKMLGNLDRWLEEGEAYATQRGFDAETLLEQRLYVDQFTLRRNVQAACDSGKFIVARATGVDAPSHEDGPQDLAQLHARIASVIAWIGTVPESAFEGSADRVVPLPFLGNKGARGEDYVHDFGLPNFYFHVNMSYAILRHCGVTLGKRAYIGSIALLDL